MDKKERKDKLVNASGKAFRLVGIILIVVLFVMLVMGLHYGGHVQEGVISDGPFEQDGVLADISSANYAKAVDVGQEYYDTYGVTESADEATDAAIGEESGMVHYDCSISIQTLDYRYTMWDMDNLIANMGATVVSSSEGDDNYDWYVSEDASRDTKQHAYFELRVKSGAFEEMLDAFDLVTGKIVSQNISSVDMTRSYNSNNDRLDALELEKAQLEELMGTAADTETLLLIYEQLTDVNTEIYSLQTRQNDILYDTDFATVYVTIEEVDRIGVEPGDDLPLLDRILLKLNNGWEDTGKALQILTLVIAYYLPVILIILVFFFVLLCARAIARKYRVIKSVTHTEMPSGVAVCVPMDKPEGEPDAEPEVQDTEDTDDCMKLEITFKREEDDKKEDSKSEEPGQDEPEREE